MHDRFSRPERLECRAEIGRGLEPPVVGEIVFETGSCAGDMSRDRIDGFIASGKAIRGASVDELHVRIVEVCEDVGCVDHELGMHARFGSFRCARPEARS